MLVHFEAPYNLIRMVDDKYYWVFLHASGFLRPDLKENKLVQQLMLDKVLLTASIKKCSWYIYRTKLENDI